MNDRIDENCVVWWEFFCVEVGVFIDENVYFWGKKIVKKIKSV